MKRPTVSIISSAFRPENWMGLYESLGENDVSLELIFVGPNAPKYELPENFQFIQSNVKPAQCFEVASRHAQGEFILWVTDDLRYITERPIDKLVEAHRSSKADNPIVGSRYRFPEGWNRFFPYDMESPIIPSYWMVSSNLWRETGGVDRRFIAVCWDMDMAMRMLASGSELVISDVYVDEKIDMPNKPRSRGSALYRDHKATDRVLLDMLWSTGGKVHFDRALPVESLSENRILTRSQEPQGRWRYNSGLYNRVITSKIYYWLSWKRQIILGRAHRFDFRKLPTYVARLLKLS